MNIFFEEDKLKSRVEALGEFRMREARQAENLRILECAPDEIRPPLPGEEENWKTASLGQTWTGRDRYLWLRCELSFPEEWKEHPLVGVFDFGLTGPCSNYGFEALLYVEGQPYQGVDTHHQEVFFPKEYAGKTVSLIFRLWSGLEGGGVPRELTHQFKTAYSAWMDEAVDGLYYTGKMILETIPLLSANDPQRSRLLSILDQTFLLIDWRREGSEAFYDSVADAWKQLDEALAGMDGKALVDLICIGHTHIDVAWLWRYKHTREKCARSFSTVLRLMEMYPEYTFLQSQPQLYEWLKKDFPEIYEGIRQRVKEGRWEIDGGMWIEADCNIPSGESLTRQILLGNAFTKKEFGKTMRYLWLPDVFGYSWALPQILKKSNLDTFVTTKISWNECNQMPYDTFCWVGIDGTKILTHFITTPAAAEEQGSWYYTYNGEMVPGSVNGIWNNYRNKGLTNELLMAYGYGDGGGGVNREELEQRRIIDRIPGLPHIQHGNVGDYFERLQERVDGTRNYFPEWDGELYLENHRGTYTSHAYNKRMNRYLEFLYRESEWIASMAALKKGALARKWQEDLTEGWKLILCNQFHDVIPGSAIREVYEDSQKEYQQAEEIAKTVEQNAIAAMSEGEGISVINNGSWVYEGLAEAEALEEGEAYYIGGEKCQTQVIGNKTYIWAKTEPMSITPVEKRRLGEPAQETEVPFSWDGSVLHTPYYEIYLNKKGQIEALYDLENQRQVVKPEHRANVLQFFEDKPVICDAWNINLFYQEKVHEVEDLVEMKMTENGPLSAVLQLVWKYGDSCIWQDLQVYAKDRRIDFRTVVDMHETHQLLKVAFPADIRTTYATYDIQYGNVRRANNWNTSWDIAKFETCLHKWVDLSDANYGVALLNDSKYGCDVKDDQIRLTLIKTATNPDYLQDQGRHEFTYSLYPHRGDVAHSDTEKSAFYLNNPLHCVKGMLNLPYFVKFNVETVSVDAVKCSEDGQYLVMRFHEFAGAQTALVVKAGFGYQEWAEANLMEEPVGEFCKEKDIRLTIHPYEVITLLFRIGDSI